MTSLASHQQSQMQWACYETKDACGKALAAQVVPLLEQAINARGKATLVVSGGSTPVPFFHALSDVTLDWSKITVLMADERWVLPEDDDSNEKLLHQHLSIAKDSILSLAPADASETVDNGAARLSEALSTYAEPFDVVILGMGDDAHTASLFPHHPMLSPALASDAPDCLPVTDSPKPPSERVTLSAKRLASTQALFLHISGEAKKTVAEKAQSEYDVQKMPISYFLHHPNQQPTIYWAAS